MYRLSSLADFTSFLCLPILQVAILAVPHRPDFYAKISQSTPQDTERHAELDIELAKWLAALEAIVRRMKDFLENGGMGKVVM
jgi:hypothetical protein